MIARETDRWESIVVNALPDGGRLVEFFAGDAVVRELRLPRDAARHLARLLSEDLPG